MQEWLSAAPSVVSVYLNVRNAAVSSERRPAPQLLPHPGHQPEHSRAQQSPVEGLSHAPITRWPENLPQTSKNQGGRDMARLAPINKTKALFMGSRSSVTVKTKVLGSVLKEDEPPEAVVTGVKMLLNSNNMEELGKTQSHFQTGCVLLTHDSLTHHVLRGHLR